MTCTDRRAARSAACRRQRRQLVPKRRRLSCATGLVANEIAKTGPKPQQLVHLFALSRRKAAPGGCFPTYEFASHSIRFRLIVYLRGRSKEPRSISYTSGVTNAVIVRPREAAAFSGKGRKVRTPIRIDELLKRFGSQDFDAVPPHVKVPTHLEMARRREANDQ